jgi:tRNA pseudouridine38-40 synthase
MRTIKLTLEYDGCRYAGWQVQNFRHIAKPLRQPVRTIQATLARTLKKILHEEIAIIGSGRTDAGVSALGQVASFSMNSALPVHTIKNALNALLPDDIVVTQIGEVRDFCALSGAQSKTYRYLIANQQHVPALLRQRVHHCFFPLNADRMRRDSAVLLGRHDFKAFCSSGSSAKSTIRTITRLVIRKIPYFPYVSVREAGGRFLFAIDIEANGFLYNMVRIIVGTLLEIGRGRFPAGSMKEILLSRDRRRAGPTACARGLYLLAVDY